MFTEAIVIIPEVLLASIISWPFYIHTFLLKFFTLHGAKLQSSRYLLLPRASLSSTQAEAYYYSLPSNYTFHRVYPFAEAKYTHCPVGYKNNAIIGLTSCEAAYRSPSLLLLRRMKQLLFKIAPYENDISRKCRYSFIFPREESDLLRNCTTILLH